MCIDPDWMPYEKFDETGNHIGITSDYFKIFQKELGIPIKAIKTKTWSESIEAAKQRKCDIYSLAMETPKRKEYMNFTTPYLSFPLVLATQLNVPFMDNVKYLQNKKVAIVTGYAFNEIIREKYPNIQVVDVKNIEEGLQKVVNGELFGFIGTLASVGYMFQKEFIGELKIAGKFDETWELGIGVRNDEPLLLDIFQKAIEHLTPQLKQDILNKHIAIRYENKTDYTLIIEILFAVFGIILFIFYHYQKLARLNQKLTLMQEELLEQAHRDPLTNLYNRRYFNEIAYDMVALSQRENKHSSVIMLDIDYFKRVNDLYGHKIGDLVLKKLALLLEKQTRKSDVIARFGGEEFVILLPNTDKKSAFHFASKLREIAEQEQIVTDEGKVFSITISLGVDGVRRGDKNIEAVLNRADEALYRAKNSGRNRAIMY